MRAAILLTYRAGNTPHRHTNLLAVVKWLAQWPDYELIVLEQDALPTLTEPLPHPRCRKSFAYNPGPFNKSWGLNVAARMSDAQVLAFGDADLIVPGMVQKSIEHCSDRYAVVKPYRRLVDLTEQESGLLLSGELNLASIDPAEQDRESRGEYLLLCCGWFVIRAAAFHKLGGWDERFRGWGGEDDALTHVVQRARLPTLEFDEVPALHLWHPRSPMTHQHYQDNRALVARYAQLSDAELQRLAEVSRNVMGYSKKYQPTS